MALFDNMGGLLGDFGFGVPSNVGGLIGDEERDAINKRALLSGIINAGLTYAATPKNLNTGSALPYLGRAGLAGFGASQDVVDRALNTAYRNKILAGRDDVFSNINPLDVTPESLKLYIEGGKKDPSLLRRAAPVEKDTTDITNYNQARKEGYTGTFTDFLELKKANTNINLNQPIPVINPKTGKAELVQFPNKPGEKPLFTGLEKAEPEVKLKAVPQAQANSWVNNSGTLKKIDDAIKAVNEAPEDSFGIANYLGDPIRQRTDKAGVDARAKVAGIGSQKFHDLSGANVTVSEAPRLQPYIPASTDTKENILKKLQNLKSEYEYTNNLIENTYSPDTGFKPLRSADVPKAISKTIKRTGTDKSGRKVIEYSDGSIEYAD